ncbi:unnamed protein product [Rhodiola kirilowii]
MGERQHQLSNETALSFQEAQAVSFIWEHIGNVQRNLQFTSINTESFHSINSEFRELPAVELSTLPMIVKVLLCSHPCLCAAINLIFYAFGDIT